MVEIIDVNKEIKDAMYEATEQINVDNVLDAEGDTNGEIMFLIFLICELIVSLMFKLLARKLSSLFSRSIFDILLQN